MTASRVTSGVQRFAPGDNVTLITTKAPLVVDHYPWGSDGSIVVCQLLEGKKQGGLDVFPVRLLEPGHPETADQDGSGSITVVNLKAVGSAVLNDPDITFVYIGRDNTKMGLKRSPLANPFAITGDDTRAMVCQRYWDEVLSPAIAAGAGAPWTELCRIAQLVIDGHQVVLGCYCSPQECHGDTIATAVEDIIQNQET